MGLKLTWLDVVFIPIFIIGIFFFGLAGSLPLVIWVIGSPTAFFNLSGRPKTKFLKRKEEERAEDIAKHKWLLIGLSVILVLILSILIFTSSRPPS